MHSRVSLPPSGDINPQPQLNRVLLSRQQQQAQSQLQTLSQEKFSCEADARKAALKLAKRWKCYQLEQLEIVEKARYTTTGRPRKGTKP